ncbi:MAG TPA: DUF1540 domain-containing protein [Polyangia bacterium]|jgi:hypothetical protein
MAIQLSKIAMCEAKQCAYNRQGECHAAAVTIGDGMHPMCDTFMAGKQGGVPETGAVGACKVADCRFNQSLECGAGKIELGLHDGHADCRTFTHR